MRPYLVVIISTNEILNVWKMPSNANPGGKHYYCSIVSKIMVYPIWSVNKCKELSISVPIKLPSETRPRLY
jgi:hypothetical protein